MDERRPWVGQFLPWLVLAITVAIWTRAWQGWPSLDHCAGVGCDFTVFYKQGRAVLLEPIRIVHRWLFPPTAALVFAIFGPLQFMTAHLLWLLINLSLTGVLIALCAKELWRLGRFGRWTVAAGLVSLSLPVVHCIKWGQISVLICVLSIVALQQVQRQRRCALLIGLAAGLKVYPLAYSLGYLVRRDWSTLTAILASTLGFGLLLPLVLLGPEVTLAFFRNVPMHEAGSLLNGAWAEGHSVAWWGGQSLQSALQRWFQDGSHVGLASPAPPLLFPLSDDIVALVWLGLLIPTAVLSAVSLGNRTLGQSHFTALSLTTTTLFLSPGWHHYFAFLPFAAAVVWGHARSSGFAKCLVTVSWLITAWPLTVLADLPQAYFHFSAWGGTAIAALLTWVALILPARRSG